MSYKKAVPICEAAGLPVNHHCWGELDSERVAAAAERYQKEGEFPARLPHDKVDITLIPKF